MKKNITFIGLINDFKKNISKAIADELDMFFADINDLMEFNLINSDMLMTAGQEYFDKNERKTLETVVSYENTVMTLNFSTLNKNNNYDILKENSLVIYLELDFETFKKLNAMENNGALTKINRVVYSDRDSLMKSIADITVKVEEVEINENIKKILNSISEYFEG